ncbi:MAG: hypothetical protein Q8L85_00295 [Alphaproteobacteria bacterium]|nr:hypothetical protein [Alphaproteobacteria bacterium]
MRKTAFMIIGLAVSGLVLSQANSVHAGCTTGERVQKCDDKYLDRINLVEEEIAELEALGRLKTDEQKALLREKRIELRELKAAYKSCIHKAVYPSRKERNEN